MKKFNEIFSATEINSLIEEKAFSHTYYYHYSNLLAIKGILESKKIYVSSMCFSNDISEHTNFEDDTYTYFQLCFSTGTTENLPLWFLYSGVNGIGARISLRKKSIKKLIDFGKMDMELVNTNTNERVILKNGENCSLFFKDIIYRKKESNKYRLKYNTQVNNAFPADEMAGIEADNKGFLKMIIWFYEKETRLLIKVHKELIDKALFQNAEKSPYRIELKIPDECYKDIEVMLSPLCGEKEFECFLSEVEWLELSKAKLKSEYAGQIKIDLCKECNRRTKLRYRRKQK